MKIAVIGGGSSYTPELVKGFLERVESLPLSELWLIDVLPDRLEVVGGFARRMVAAKGHPFQVRLATDRRQGIAEASYVITQLRVGWMEARRQDEYLGRRHGLVGQETTGIGGMAKALRTIPVILDIARDIEELTPGALLVNFTNPAGLVTEALARHAPQVTSAGVCNGPITTQMRLAELLAGPKGRPIDAARTRLDTLGLNHLSWHRGFTVDGEDRWPQVMATILDQLRHSEHPQWDPALIEALQLLPNSYLSYYYDTARRVAEQARWPETGSRAEQVMAVERNLLAQYADPTLHEPPADLMQRGGAYYSTVATQLLNAHHSDLGETHVVNLRHNGAVPGWPADWVLEMPARVSRQGIEPLPAKPLPAVCFGLLAQVKAYELLTVEAAVHGDRDAAYQALLAHPLGPPAHQVSAVLEDLLETHRQYLPQFWQVDGQ